MIPLTTPTTPTTPRTILVVDDDPASARLTRELLAAVAPTCAVQTVADGRRALGSLRDAGPPASPPRPDLMLLDWHLPGVTGLEVLTALKADPRWRHLPVIICSASADSRDVCAAYDAHANGYIVKDPDLARFHAALAALAAFWLGAALLPPRF